MSKIIEVSMQPGNNYRAAASLIREALIQNTTIDGQPFTSQQHADRLGVTAIGPAHSPNGQWSGYEAPLVWSKMLTVWRKLNVEVDSMSAEPIILADRSPDWDGFNAQEILAGEATTIITGKSLSTGGLLAAGEARHYEGGVLEHVIPPLSLPIRYDTSTWDHNYGWRTIIYATGSVSPAELVQMLGNDAIVKDDDPDQGQLPRSYHIQSDPFIRSAYGASYIYPTNVPEAYNPQPITPFVLHVSDVATYFGVGWDNTHDQFSQSDYWTSFVVMAYQPAGHQDADPDPFQQAPLPPLTDEGWLCGVTHFDSDNASLVFLEVIRDQGVVYQNLGTGGTDISHTIAHEMGHAQGTAWLRSESQDHSELGIMSTGAPTAECCFSAQTIVRFRSTNTW